MILGALVEMCNYDLSQRSSSLALATTLATASIANLTDTSHVVHDYACEPNCAPDGTQFKGIYARNLAKLQKAAPQDLYAQVINASEASTWKNDRDKRTNQLSVDCTGPSVSSANASTHSSAMDALVAAIALGF